MHISWFVFAVIVSLVFRRCNGTLIRLEKSYVLQENLMVFRKKVDRKIAARRFRRSIAAASAQCLTLKGPTASQELLNLDKISWKTIHLNCRILFFHSSSRQSFVNDVWAWRRANSLNLTTRSSACSLRRKEKKISGVLPIYRLRASEITAKYTLFTQLVQSG